MIDCHDPEALTEFSSAIVGMTWTVLTDLEGNGLCVTERH